MARLSAPSSSIRGGIDYLAYLSPGDPPTDRTTLYLLHGRGDRAEDWYRALPMIERLVVAGDIPSLVAVMPDAPWTSRASFYVDSLYVDDPPRNGEAVESAFTADLIPHVDGLLPTRPDRRARVIAGYSMGAAGALRYALAHRALFSAGIILSPAVYVPTPPMLSSAREFGAFGVGGERFSPQRYESLNYPRALAESDALPLRLHIAVGDAEYTHLAEGESEHDLEVEAARLHNRLKRAPGVVSRFRVHEGGHDWSVWLRGLEEGLRAMLGHGI